MKRVLILGVVVLQNLVVYGQSRERLKVEDIPAVIAQYAKENLSDFKLKSVYKELKEDGELEFEVNFNKGLQLEFNGNSELTEVERRKGIPAQYISPSLAKYISVNYPMIQVVEIDFNKDGSQEVSLRNGVELLFDSKGQFVK